MNKGINLHLFFWIFNKVCWFFIFVYRNVLNPSIIFHSWRIRIYIMINRRRGRWPFIFLHQDQFFVCQIENGKTNYSICNLFISYFQYHCQGLISLIMCPWALICIKFVLNFLFFPNVRFDDVTKLLFWLNKILINNGTIVIQTNLYKRKSEREITSKKL